MKYVCVNPEKLSRRVREKLELLDKSTRTQYIHTALELLTHIVERGIVDDLGFSLLEQNRELLRKIVRIRKTIEMQRLKRELELETRETKRSERNPA